MRRERFAPSPTGYLHLGHAFSALTAWDAAQKTDGEFLLRIEDIDFTRARAEYEAAIFEDLAWLGMRWPKPVMRQSERMDAYKNALNQLISQDICYPCRCTRRDITQALSAPQEGDQQVFGPDGVVYPGLCRAHLMADLAETDAIRLDMRKAVRLVGRDFLNLMFTEIDGQAPVEHHLSEQTLIEFCGDIVLARRDIGTSYHLAVVVDDAAQQISHVTRGRDMFAATQIHRLLQALLNLPTPIYRHHRLIRDKSGKRLAKRDDALAIRSYRQRGLAASDIRQLLGLGDGLA
ncbi:MAG: tRNA glutamyl-Q(34) synthetase GluQRS [Alphaproteobacteria bacterium]|nr:tRNA glutamyl-Q(34) synthetase GluQRS [Alphaproteobacteria bacterium]